MNSQLSIKGNLIEKARKSWMNIFIERYKISYLVAVFIVIIGLLSLYRVPKESAPNIDFGIIQVGVSYFGASAYDMDQLVIQELENQLKDVDGVNKMTSVASNSFASVTLELEPTTDTDVAMNDIRNAVDQAKPKLPSDAEDPIVTKITSSQDPIFNIQLTGNLHPTLLRDYAEQLKSHLESLAPVKEVEITGGAEREVFVDLDPAKLRQYNLSVGEVVAAIRAANRDDPAGSLEISELEYSVRVAGRLRGAEDARAIVLRVQRGDDATAAIRLADIARVYEIDQETDSTQLFIEAADGQVVESAVSLRVLKVDGADIFRADPLVRQEALDFVSRQFGDAVTVHFTSELLENVRDSYSTVTSSAWQSVLIVVLILAVFVRVGESLVASLVIPLSFLITIAFTFFIGGTLNFMVNFSMILALGILVDVSIVIVEGISDALKKGYSPKDAAIVTLYEFRAPLLSGTLTTLAVFIPLLVLPGVLGQYLSYIPISVSVTLIASLLVSMLLIPGIAASVLRAHSHADDLTAVHPIRRRLNAFYAWRDLQLERLSAAYQRLIRRLLRSRLYRIGSFYVLLLLCFASFLIPIPFNMFPSDDFDFMNVSVELPEGTVKEATLRATLPVQEIILRQPEVEKLFVSVNGSDASLQIELFKKDDRAAAGQRTSIQLADVFRGEFEQFKTYKVSVDEAETGPPVAAPVQFRVIAESPDRLDAARQVAADFQAMLREIPGTDNIRDDITTIPGEMNYSIDREAALRLGVDPAGIATALRAALDGVEASTISRGSREADIRVRYAPESVQSFADLGDLQLPSSTGSVSLSQVVDSSFGAAFSQIRRVDRQIAVSVMSDLQDGGNALEVTTAFQEKVEAYELPAGISYEDAGENAENADLFFALAAGFFVALLLMFTILVVQFDSFSQPAIIMFTIVMSLLGVNLGLALTDTPRSLAFIIGFISLAGIVVNDAIILVDRMNNLRTGDDQHEHDLTEIAAHAGASRLSPILVTTLTTIAGIGPLVFVDTFWAGLGYTIVFGLATATLLTLFVTPAMYIQLAGEGGITFGPLGLLAGLGLVLGGAFSLNPVMILLGLMLLAGCGYLFWRSLRRVRGGLDACQILD